MSLRKFFSATLSLGIISFPAYAYIDPGTGSVVFQAIIASLVAGAATARLWWDKVLYLLNIKKDHKSADPAISSEKDETNQ